MRVQPIGKVEGTNNNTPNNQKNNPFREKLKNISAKNDEKTHQKSFAEMLKEKMDEGR